MGRDALSTTFAALADATRRDILGRLREGPHTVGDLAGHYAMSRPAVSQHLKVLERAGLVARGRRAQWNDCSLEPASLDEASAWIEQQRLAWSDRLDRLEEHLRERRRTTMIDSSKGFTLVRTLDASPEEVWTAWTDPDSAAQWWHPRNTTTPRESVEIDARVGGRYTYTMVDDETGGEVVTGGVYREVTPFERLVFTWGEPDADPDDTPVITITLEPDGERTRMTFDLRGVDGAAGDGSFYDGWVEALDCLEEHLAPA